MLAAGRRVVRSSRMGGAYLVLTREDAQAVLDDPVTYSSAYALGGPLRASLPGEVVAELPSFLWEPVSAVVDADPPEHERLHATVQRAYAGPRINPLASRITELAEELAEDLSRRSAADLVAEYAMPLVRRTMGAVMGVPPDEVGAVASWAQDMAALITPDTPTPDKIAAARRLGEYERWARDFFAALPPGHDSAAGVYAHGEAGAEPFTAAGMANNLLVHWVAGTVTTCHAITTAAYQLLRDRKLWEWAVAAPEPSSARALEEGLRHSAPHRGLIRVTTRETELGGVVLPAGTQVLPMLGAANRDPGHTPDAHVFDPRRDRARDHLAFGAGIHSCVGAHLARLEGRIALSTLLTRHPALRLSEPDHEPPLMPGPFFHGLTRLPVTGLTP
jgi:cytochrome P450